MTHEREPTETSYPQLTHLVLISGDLHFDTYGMSPIALQWNRIVFETFPYSHNRYAFLCDSRPLTKGQPVLRLGRFSQHGGSTFWANKKATRVRLFFHTRAMLLFLRLGNETRSALLTTTSTSTITSPPARAVRGYQIWHTFPQVRLCVLIERLHKHLKA